MGKSKEITYRKSSSIQELWIQKFQEGALSEVPDRVAIEEPLEIRISFIEEGKRKTKKVSITMRTPGNDLDLALGFLFTEGILKNKSDFFRLGEVDFTCQVNKDNIIQVDLADGIIPQVNQMERNFYTTSSCGVCGKASIEAIKTVQETNIQKDLNWSISQEILMALPEKLRVEQQVFDVTGGLHACALFNDEGELMAIHEDVGRHNALDKLIGGLFTKELLPLNRSILLLSGRASFELIQKAAMAGFGLVASVGAPSSLAIELAREMGITLIGFLNKKRFNIYTFPHRIRFRHNEN